MSEHVPNRIRRATVLALASSPLAVSTRAHAADNWQAYTFWGSPTVVASKGFRKIVTDMEEASGGELKIKFNLGGTLSINAANIGSSISDDIIQLADDSFYAGAIPVASLATLPFLTNSIEEVTKVMTVVRPIVERDYGKRGVTMLGYYIYPPQVFWFRGNVTSLDQVKGRKLRVSTAEQGDFLKRIGATPVQVTSAEVPAALERGIVDGVLTASAGGILAWKDLLKSSYQLGVNYHVSYIIANTARLQKLPADMQAQDPRAREQELRRAHRGPAARRRRAAPEVRCRRHRDDRRHGQGPRERRDTGEGNRRCLGQVARSRGSREPGQGARAARPMSTPEGSSAPIGANAFERLCGLLSKAALVAMMVLIAAELVLRNVFHVSWESSEEMSSYLLVALTFLSLATCQVYGGYHELLIVKERLSPRARLWLEVAMQALCLACAAVLTWYFMRMVIGDWKSDERSLTALRVPLWLPRLTMPLGTAALCVALVLDIRHRYVRLASLPARSA